MSRDPVISTVPAEMADPVPSVDRQTAVSLPGSGFSLWMESARATASPAVNTASFYVGRGFSLPDEKQPSQARSHVLRGFSKNQITRIVRPALNGTSTENPPVAGPQQTEPVNIEPPAPKAPQAARIAPLPEKDEVPAKSVTPIEPIAPSPAQPAPTTTAKTTIETAPAQSSERTIDPSQPMTSPSSVHLPGNGFSVWTKQSPACHSIRLVSDSPSDADQGGSPTGSSGSGGSNNGTTSNFKTYPEPSKGGGGFLKWAALFLFLCALGAFLSSESGRKKVMAERDTLQVEKEGLTKEKQTLHDNWVGEQAKTAKLTDEVSGLETSLSESKANITTLTAEKTGLSKTIEQLQGTLAMTIDEAKNTEMTLRKAISGLETKNEQLTSNLQQEREKLSGLDTRLAEVMSELNAAKASNEKLVEANAGLEEKVAQLQTMLDKAVKDAETSEAELRSELAELKKANEELTNSLASQKEALTEAEAKLKEKEQAIADDKKEDEKAQSKVQDLSEKLTEAVAARDALNEEKQALAASVAQMSEQLKATASTSPTTIALKERITNLEADKNKSSKQVKELAAARDRLLDRNAELQASVEALNANLSKLAESEETQENSLTKRIKELTKTNETLQQSLEKQRTEFDTLLRSANRAQSVTERSASTLKGAMGDLKEALGHSLQRETNTKEQLSSLLVDHTNQMLELNTKVAKTTHELDSTKGLLSELDSLREEVQMLRGQGQSLENELAQRAIHISSLNNDNASWQQETEKLRKLLQTEQLAQNKLREFANDLQLRITDLETPVQAVATK